MERVTSPALHPVSFPSQNPFEARRMRFAGVEGGGTTWVAAIAEGDPSNIVARPGLTPICFSV